LGHTRKSAEVKVPSDIGGGTSRKPGTLREPSDVGDICREQDAPRNPSDIDGGTPRESGGPRELIYVGAQAGSPVTLGPHIGIPLNTGNPTGNTGGGISRKLDVQGAQ